ncbi:MAG: bifunctional phosphopantothenoylcysteine decarboxylase/phosphopantothenate--cysteine ligase CoaBC [Marinilabiliaceae bacterium]|nr:bifunctional phosphopantothenoylcysteine decarboxylase/phosphopantothenate--cysteine ligase CoaBC [Marinilabiliaceae bacterium]
MLKGKKIILGITGSIAAYKAAYLLRLLKKEGAEVQVLITKAGKEFITPVTLSALSNRPVLGEFFQTQDGTWNSHVDLGLWADLMLIAPASANTIAKMASGICDNLLLTTYLSAKCSVIIAPAMDLDMFDHVATQNNIRILSEAGCDFIDPGSGELASGLFGKGRMEEPDVIVEKIKEFFSKSVVHSKFNGQKVLITAGPTYEAIDPVRFIGNNSSGKMGYAIAEELASRGAEVHLVSGPSSVVIKNKHIHLYSVKSASEMYKVSKKIFSDVRVAIFAAAVADYTPLVTMQEKLKRESSKITIELVETNDIAFELGKVKSNKQITVGFALETQSLIENAKKKLNSKNFDFIVLNQANKEGTGFNVDTNQITILDKNNNVMEYPLKQKRDVAFDIIDKLETYL